MLKYQPHKFIILGKEDAKFMIIHMCMSLQILSNTNFGWTVLCWECFYGRYPFELVIFWLHWSFNEWLHGPRLCRLDIGFIISILGNWHRIGRWLIGYVGLLYLHSVAHNLLIAIDILQLYPIGHHFLLFLFQPVANIFFRRWLVQINHFLITVF